MTDFPLLCPIGSALGLINVEIPLAALEKPIDARFLSAQEREVIRDLQAAGTSIRAAQNGQARWRVGLGCARPMETAHQPALFGFN